MLHSLHVVEFRQPEFSVDFLVRQPSLYICSHTTISYLLHYFDVTWVNRECLCVLIGCRTGEAKLTRGYRLAARCVIHTVGPRYNAKYRTAAENALFNCYRNVLLLLR